MSRIKFFFLTLFISLILIFPSRLLCGIVSREEVKLERKQNKILYHLVTKLAHQHEMKLLLYGVGDLVDSKDSRNGYSLVDFRLATIDQARPLVVSILKAMWQKFNGDPIFRYWLRIAGYNKLYKYAFAMKISYWDRNYDRPFAPSLSQVRIAEDKISYYYACPKDQSLVLAHEETIPEAFTIVEGSYSYQ